MLTRRPWPRPAYLLGVALGSLLVLACGTVTVHGDNLATALRRIDDWQAEELQQLAAWCRERELPDLAQRTERWLPARDPFALQIFDLSAAGDFAAGHLAGSDAKAGSAADKVAWLARFTELRRRSAERYFALAKQAAERGETSLAYDLICRTAREDPDHEQARAILGYQRHDGQWHTPHAVRQLAAGNVWHERFGWIGRDDVDRYERGERRLGNRWITAEQDRRLHADIDRGWKIETEHYQVTTNHSLEEGVRLAVQLERLHRAWRQVFAGYWLNDAQLAAWLGGRLPRRHPLARTPAARHRVVYFRDRDQYVEHLRRIEPRIAMSIGYYLDRGRVAYFFAGEGQDPGTVYHEATHQLFQETLPGTRLPGRRDNFWIVEAIACYMESIGRNDHGDTLGGADSGRLPAARERLLVDGFYVPFAELVTYDAGRLQRDPRIASIYSQSAGQAAMLMHHDAGRYRDPLVTYLHAVYHGRSSPETLGKLAGRSYGELDEEYREFLKRFGPP